MAETLEQFLEKWDRSYQGEASAIPLFKQDSTLSREQQQRFARAFYHARGHFSQFLWHMASWANTSRDKQAILANMADEFGLVEGKNLPSHEQLYAQFATCLGVDVREEVLTDRTNLPFIKQFNEGHIHFLASQNELCQWAAFSAYERLDNTDYNNLYKLASKFGIPQEGMVFFDVHRKGDHYDQIGERLREVWDADPQAVRDGFKFIGDHQLKLWRNLSDYVIA